MRQHTIQAVKQQILHERTLVSEQLTKKVEPLQIVLADVRLMNENLIKLNDELKRENDEYTQEKVELQNKISELLQAQFDM